MKRQVQQAMLALFATAVVVFATGCESLHPPIVMDPIENHGGGGGDAS